ncbi:uncharacterized protein RHO25_012106 [Cercospora beticola]|uniref:Uncharacterized protein n=1 Tax=Cercospora beticola TaxID=122368 RepID=A0ABZ0P6P1_CERBT|nr:hypothetical protein RHO25_012106 [Cercospora beticola]
MSPTVEARPQQTGKGKLEIEVKIDSEEEEALRKDSTFDPTPAMGFDGGGDVD